MRTPLAALLAVALVAVAVVAVLVATGRSGSSSSPSSACAASWASATSGRPVLVADRAPGGVFLWHSGGSWHVTLRGAPVPLVGRVSSDGPLRVGSPSSSLAPDVSATSREVSFRSPSSGKGSLVFRASCGSGLAFSFASKATPSVFLGRARQAVSPRFLLGRSETTGVSGQLYSSGGCPTLTIGQSCPSAKPLRVATQIQVLTAPQSKTGGAQPQLVKTIASAGDGSYTASLEAGRYLLQSPGQLTPGSASFTPVEVTVAPGVMTVADLSVDSGIR
jgi:hypothetical protein